MGADEKLRGKRPRRRRDVSRLRTRRGATKVARGKTGIRIAAEMIIMQNGFYGLLKTPTPQAVPLVFSDSSSSSVLILSVTASGLALTTCTLWQWYGQ